MLEDHSSVAGRNEMFESVALPRDLIVCALVILFLFYLQLVKVLIVS